MDANDRIDWFDDLEDYLIALMIGEGDGETE
jgi:hypothetical protein